MCVIWIKSDDTWLWVTFGLHTVSYANANAVYPGGLCQGHLFPTEPHLPLGSRSADGVVCVTADSILFHWSVSLAVPSPGPIVPVNVSSQ